MGILGPNGYNIPAVPSAAAFAILVKYGPKNTAMTVVEYADTAQSK
jgi:hypothetical protein